ncbi:hypothetical protein AJ79_09733 [Helicocarpus griseus UAMH5409]|uniref:Carotenoid oxygenase n=1 Tax=Helicocarpus griseus UAMH5409 TaxID=1447875 RepID=A0A2B7WHT8_9EURO|nr:hypothetical protein AJ79_09733 [Helicocarpus griseus UAMH5409]
MTSSHPFLKGNFAPVSRIRSLEPCSFEGHIPDEFIGGQYIRNGSNPIGQLSGKAYHWFDGDGMLTGVYFRRTTEKPGVQPGFANQYVQTDVYLASKRYSEKRLPLIPSISTMLDPDTSLFKLTYQICRTITAVAGSFIRTSQKAIRRISVANTNILYHDGRVLALCESGPPMQVLLPSLETVGWFNGVETEDDGDSSKVENGFGGSGLLRFLKEWTTAHPLVDPRTSELILFHSTFLPPYVRYSVLPSVHQSGRADPGSQRLLGVTVPGIKSSKMMHDFGVSPGHTVVIDHPLFFNPLNSIKGQPVLQYNAQEKSRFGVFPRHSPSSIRWFESSPCCIFHTVNTWDDSKTKINEGITSVVAVNMLVCHMVSASIVYVAGNINAPKPKRRQAVVPEEHCRLYYYQFDLSQPSNKITHEWALSTIPFEFPTLPRDQSLGATRYVYGCSSAKASYKDSLVHQTKVDCLVKVDVKTLIERGKSTSLAATTGFVDGRSMAEILASTDPKDPIKAFKMPEGIYAQERSFVKRKGAREEDAGWLVTFVFDEAQLETGRDIEEACSELWIIDAKYMQTVVGKVRLPQRVPYGFHGSWFTEEKIRNQLPVEKTR